MARRKPQTPAQDVEPSGLDEFHPDTTHNPATPRQGHPEPGLKPPQRLGRTGEPILDRRKRFRTK